MDSNPFSVLEKSDAVRRHQIHGQPQEKRLDFRHTPPGTKIIRTYGRQRSEDYFRASLRDVQSRHAKQVRVRRTSRSALTALGAPLIQRLSPFGCAAAGAVRTAALRTLASKHSFAAFNASTLQRL